LESYIYDKVIPSRLERMWGGFTLGICNVGSILSTN
jgi:hypothetical protein